MMKTLNRKDAFFDVEATELVFPDSVETSTGVYGLRRTDNGLLLGTASSRYGITQNRDLAKVAEQGFKSVGLNKFKTSVNLVRNGARTYMTYDFQDDAAKAFIRVAGISKDDVMGLRMTLVNSFDGSVKRAIRLGVLRLVCTNGMMGFKEEFSLEHRHTTGNVEIDTDMVFKAIANAKSAFERVITRYQVFSNVDVPQELGDALLNYMVSKKIVGVRMSEQVGGIWANPSFEEDQPRNLYSFVNAWTQYLDSPHSEYGVKHYETAQNTKAKVFDFVNKIAVNPKRLVGLVDVEDFSDYSLI